MSPQFHLIEINGGTFFGIYETIDDDRELVRPIAVSSNIDDAHIVTKAINFCHDFAPSHDADLYLEPPVSMENLEAAFCAAIDQWMYFRIYAVPDETEESLRLIVIVWDEEDAKFIRCSLNFCSDLCDGPSRGYVCAPIDWQPIVPH